MIVCIVGPSGVGKTKLSISLAKKYHGIVVNTDSTQVYKMMNIGTAKIKENEKDNIPHYLFDICDPNDNYSIFEYQTDLRKVLIEHQDQNIILVGGSGLYIKAGLFDYELNPRVKNEYEELTNEELFNIVKSKYPQSDIHVNNRKRLINYMNSDPTKNQGNHLLYNVVFIGLTIDRAKLYEIVDMRVESMIKEGLVAEVKELYDNNIRSKAVMTAIGYKELYEFFDGKISLDEAISNIKRNTRHYIKRQYTWYRNQMNVNWFNVDLENFDHTINEIISFIDKVHDK